MPGRHPANNSATKPSGLQLLARAADLEKAGQDERTPLIDPMKRKLLGGSSSDKDSEEDPPALCSDPIGWVRSLSNNYSWRLLAMVVCTNHLLKGFVAGGGDEGLVGKPIEFIFGGMGVSAGRLQMLKAAAIAPWALKPVVALLSDAMPICGYKKMPYVIITSVMSLFACLAMGLGMVTSAEGVVACLFIIFLQVSSVDLLVEAKQSEEVKQNAKMGPQFFTFTWLGINFGQVAAVCVLGPMIYHFGPHLPYLVAAPFIALVLWPTMCNFLNEKPLPPEERNFNFRLINKHPILCSLTLMIGFLIIMLIVCTFTFHETQLIGIALTFAGLVLAGFLMFIRIEICGPVVFYFMLGMLSFNIDGALFYFYTDQPHQYPEGPHFTSYFYTTALGIATFGGIMVGFMTGGDLFKEWSYRGILKLTIFLRAGTQLLLMPVLLRWTPGWGIPDGAWVVVCVALDSMVFAWRWIPKQIMGAHLTPHGVEATMLGLTAGTFNMAMILSSYCGGHLLHRYGIAPTGAAGEGHVFDDLWKVHVLAALSPCFMVFLLPALIPSKLQTEPLLVERPDSATYNSAYEVGLSGLRQRRGL
jgi:MFS family permease